MADTKPPVLPGPHKHRLTLAASIAVVLFSGCGDSAQDPEATPPTPVVEDAAPTAGVPVEIAEPASATQLVAQSPLPLAVQAAPNAQVLPDETSMSQVSAGTLPLVHSLPSGAGLESVPVPIALDVGPPLQVEPSATVPITAELAPVPGAPIGDPSQDAGPGAPKVGDGSVPGRAVSVKAAAVTVPSLPRSADKAPVAASPPVKAAAASGPVKAKDADDPKQLPPTTTAAEVTAELAARDSGIWVFEGELPDNRVPWSRLREVMREAGWELRRAAGGGFFLAPLD